MWCCAGHEAGPPPGTGSTPGRPSCSSSRHRPGGTRPAVGRLLELAGENDRQGARPGGCATLALSAAGAATRREAGLGGRRGP
ncbi:hypothetical protein [Streptomyces thioluteus]|uniref:hypothetical protein n=1 Tax=Streptomyces thioluteus TaxID=66431 RepID=UPI0031EF430C